jgi:4-diphosphocytidyl-2-C-methyl-D-erythritol kinase
VRVRAFAKINRSLRVLGTRGDGYHELRTIFQSIALHDTLTIRAARGPLRLTCDDPSCPGDQTNLIWRAAERAWRAAGRRGAPRGVAVDVQKRIPLNAGLGGGSSDAAAALRAFGRLWRVNEARLRHAAGELGADVPYFFEGGTVLGLARGDLLFPLIDGAPAWVLLVLPDFGVSTAHAFGWWDDDRALGLVIRRDAHQGTSADLVNDLEAPVAARHPEIRRVILALGRARASQAAMTGSGSTVFGLFSSRRAAERARRAVESPSRRTIVTTTIDRSRFARLSAPRGR